MNNIIEETVNWMLTEANTVERRHFLKRLFDVLPEVELRKVSSLASKAKKRRKRIQADVEKSVVKGHYGSVQRDSLSAPVVLASDRTGWYRKWKHRNIVAIDVEKIDVPTEFPSRKHKFDQKAASVSVVQWDGNVVYQAKIFRPYNSYRVTSHSIKKNGFTSTSLQSNDCKPLEQVQEDLNRILNGKLIVAIEVENDLASLDLATADYDVFDLQWHYFLTFESPGGKIIKERLGLRSLCKKFFFFDMQPESVPHDATVDAFWTLDIFKLVYTKIKPEPTSMYSDLGYNGEIQHFNTLYN